MSNPILKDQKSISIYMLLWITAAVFQFLYTLPHFPTEIIFLFASALIQNIMLAFIFLGAWFGLRYIKIENQKPLYFVSNHLIYLLVILAIWMFLCNTINYIILNNVYVSYQKTIAPIKYLLGIFSYLLFVSYLYIDAYYNSYLQKVQKEQKLEQSLKETELNLLKIQLNPHFIFNALNSISSLTLISPEKAHEMIIKMSDFLRYTIHASKEPMVSLENEIEMCKAYLDIEKIRFGSRINFEFDLQTESLKVEIPAMLLQTLFENAIKHGVYQSIQSERIYFSSKIEDSFLSMTLKNSFDPSSTSSNGTKTGLINVKNRLDLIYNSVAILQTSAQDSCFTVTLKLPIL